MLLRTSIEARSGMETPSTGAEKPLQPEKSPLLPAFSLG
jgi:hypothetical protein